MNCTVSDASGANCRLAWVCFTGELKSCQDSVKGGDVVEVRELVKRNFKRTDKFGNARVKAMTIVYEDDHLAVVVKPAGV